MKSKLREQIAIALFTGAIISFFILIESLSENLFYKILILLILFIIIYISLKVILDPSTDLHFIGNISKKILRINRDYH